MRRDLIQENTSVWDEHPAGQSFFPLTNSSCTRNPPCPARCDSNKRKGPNTRDSGVGMIQVPVPSLGLKISPRPDPNNSGCLSQWLFSSFFGYQPLPGQIWSKSREKGQARQTDRQTDRQDAVCQFIRDPGVSAGRYRADDISLFFTPLGWMVVTKHGLLPDTGYDKRLFLYTNFPAGFGERDGTRGQSLESSVRQWGRETGTLYTVQSPSAP